MNRRPIAYLMVWVVAALGTAGCTKEVQVDGSGPITFVDGADTSLGGQIRALVETWNRSHNDGQKVNFLELQPDTDILRSQMVAHAQDLADAGAPEAPVSGCYDVIMTDVIRTPEFARAGYIAELDPRDFDTSAYLQPPLRSAMVDGRLYAIPMRTDAAFLYYRKDILTKYGQKAPTDWPALIVQAKTIAPKEKIDGYVSQFSQYEGLTVNLMEAIWAVSPTADRDRDLRFLLESPAGERGIRMLAEGFSDGWIPGAAAGYIEEDSRERFQSGQALFMRNWPYAYALLNDDPQIKGKFDIAPLPGPSVLGGWNLAIGACSVNRRTARDFMAFLSSESSQRTLFEKAGFAPTIAALYDDPRLLVTYPYLAQLKTSVNGAMTRPSTAYYPRVTEAIQEHLHPVLARQQALDVALPALLTDVTQAMAGR
jgi:multiple sugar transport system substrate-binding protein